MSLDVDLNLEIDRDRPDAESDSTTKAWRGGRYGEGYVLNLWNGNHGLADEGSYFTANTVPGTAVASAVNATVSETAGNFIYIKNNDAPDNGRSERIYLDYIRLLMTVVPASATAGHFFIKMDRGDRYTSGGSQLTPLNTNIGKPSNEISQIFCGALTTTAPSPSARLACRGVLRSAIPVVNDEFVFKFGGVESPTSIQLGGTAAQRMVIPCPPIVLAPQTNACMQLWFPSNSVTPPSFEVEIGMIER